MLPELQSATRRFVELVEAVEHTNTPALGTWSVADTVAHVRSVAAIDAHAAVGSEPDAEVRPLIDRALTNRASVHDAFTDFAVEWAKKRDGGALSRAIAADVDRLAFAVCSRGPDAPVTWLAGMKLTAAAMAGHMISELLVHGFDLASATGQPFDVPDGEAKHFFEAFLPAVIPAGWDSGFFDWDRSGLAPVRWRSRVRGGSTTAFALEGDRLSRVDPAEGPFDLTISGRASALLLVMYGRVSRNREALRGRIAVWGRRPWRFGRVNAALRTL